VLSISRVLVELRIEHCRIIKIKILIIVERFVERQQDRKRRKKINKFKKILNVKKLRRYKRLLILILKERSKLRNAKSKNR